AALLVTAAVFAAGGVVMVGMREPGALGQSSAPLLRDALGAIGYVVRNVTLRGIALCLFVLNVGAGILIVTLPVLVLDHLHGGAAQVGMILAAQGAGGVVSALLFGRLGSEGRERIVMAITAAVAAAATALLLVAGNLLVVAVASLLIGLATGPLDVAIFSLRQRATEVAWFGRAIAVSMSLNFSGSPVGSALTGPLLHFGINFALLVSVLFTLAAAAVALVAIPRRLPAKLAAATS
ncbi:MAG TPA: MFS transporter, partial [Candidatus Dormibacteraeota bacterium]|nr:MFS transporter [Candidatus Dormibacteraeota bacterium]